MNIETALREHFEANESVRETITWDEIVERFEDEPVPVVAPVRRRRGVWVAVAAAVLTLLLIGLIPLLTPREDSPPLDSVVPTTVVEVPPTTVVTPTTTPAGQSTSQVEEQAAVGDDRLALAFAQSFPLNQEPESVAAAGPDPSSGRTAKTPGTGGWVEVEALDGEEPFGEVLVSFMAFETEELASEYLADQLTDPERFVSILEVYTFSGLGDEASGRFVANRGRGGGSRYDVNVRRGRFVAQVFAVPYDDEGGSAVAIEHATSIAEIADETVRSVLSSDVQSLEATSETLTSYHLEIFVQGWFIEEIVTPDAYSCTFEGMDEGGQRGVAIVNGESFESPRESLDWIRSPSDSPMFEAAQGFCQIWSPNLEASYLADLLQLSEGHVGTEQGRPTTSHWFTKEDLIEVGVLAPSDEIKGGWFNVVVDDAGPWLAGLSVVMEGEIGAFTKLMRMDLPGLEEPVFDFAIDIGSFNDTRRLLEELVAMVQPRT